MDFSNEILNDFSTLNISESVLKNAILFLHLLFQINRKTIKIYLVTEF